MDYLVAIKLEPLFLYKNQHHWTRAFVGSLKATESSPLNFLAIEAGKHASKSFVAVNVMDNMFVLIRLFREINSSINSTTATSISLTEFPEAVVAPRIKIILWSSFIFSDILIQGLIDESYKQFTEAVADGRNLPVEEVRKFADGRIFTGTQAKELGLVDEVGDDFVARELAAEMVNIDPKIQPLTFGKKKKKILGLIPGSRMIYKIINNIFFEFDSSNKVLWLYKP